MADEMEDVKGGEEQEKDRGDGKKGKPPGKKAGKGFNKLLLLIPVVVVALAAGGYYGYTLLSHGKGKAGMTGSSAGNEKKAVLFSLDPFVVNLSEPGRYLKVTMQFEVAGDTRPEVIVEKVPILRDVIITLISSQTYEYASSPEGKTQLKDDILLRTNQIFGKEVFRNLYFTDFVMQ
ncbi:MAG: flagellar basal body-associated FliL family protein [Desulfobacteria bacterium]